MPDIETPAAETSVVESAPADTGGDKSAVSSTDFDRTALYTKMDSAMAEARKDNVFGDDDDAKLEEETGEEVPAETAEETPAAETEVKEGETETETPAAAAVDKTASLLPAAYRRTLKAYDWTDAEIDANFAINGPKFLETAAKLHQTRNAETAKWAEIGRKEVANRKDTPAAKLESLSPVDIAKLKAEYGDDKLIDSIVGPVNSAIDRINSVLPIVQQTQDRAQQAQLENLAGQIDGFFGGPELAPYKETYGTSSKTLKPEQIEARNKVLESADALMVGASMQGRTLQLNDALQMALDSQTGTVKTEVARKQIVQTLKQRNNGITIAPTARGRSGAAKPGDRSALESKVKSGLASIFA